MGPLGCRGRKCKVHADYWPEVEPGPHKRLMAQRKERSLLTACDDQQYLGIRHLKWQTFFLQHHTSLKERLLLDGCCIWHLNSKWSQISKIVRLVKKEKWLDDEPIHNGEELTAVDELLSCVENLCISKNELWVVTDLKMKNYLQWSDKHYEEGNIQTDPVLDLFSE